MEYDYAQYWFHFPVPVNARPHPKTNVNYPPNTYRVCLTVPVYVYRKRHVMNEELLKVSKCFV